MTTTSNNSDKKNSFTNWLAEHPTIRLIGTVVAILGGLLGIFSFATGVNSFPELFLLLRNGKYYDRFDTQRYDGNFDTALWQSDGNTGVLVEQRDGSLIIQTKDILESSNFAMLPLQQSPIPFEEFRAFEAKMKMSSNIEGTGFLKTMVFTIRGDNDWWIECKLESDKPKNLYYACNVQTGKYDNTNTPIYEYETEKIKTNFDTWYRSRFEIISTANLIRFYLDYRLVGEYKYGNELFYSSLYPQIGSFIDVSNNFLGFYDDIIIEREP